VSGGDDDSVIGDGVSKKPCKSSSDKSIGYDNHDTISMAVIDSVRILVLSLECML
jgi:hypothetical protein